jgi:Peptidase family M28
LTVAVAGNRGLVLALAGIALLLVSTLLAYRPPAPRGPQAPPQVFSAYRAKVILRDLMGAGVPHPIGSPADAQLRQAIVDRLSALGYSVELQSGLACNDGACGRPVNIIAKLGGRPRVIGGSGEHGVVLLAAHYDSVPAGPGASDDGAGVAAVLEIARILAGRPPAAHPIVLLITDGEEAGLLGAMLFVHEHPLAKQVAAAVNVEARGTSGPSMMFETGSANTWLMRLYAAAVARPITNSLYYVVYKQLANDTDFTAFKQAGYQGFNFAIIGNVGRYHTPLDNVVNADDGSIQHQGDSALAVLSALASSPEATAPPGESVFFDGFARMLIAWPARFTLPAALALLALLLAETEVLLRRRAVAWREILWAEAGLLGMLAAGVLLCAALLSLLIAAGRVPPIHAASWVSEPLPMHAAAAAIALMAAGGAGAWLGQRAGFWGFWAAAALNAALASVICALVAPGASFVVLLTALAAAVGVLPALLRRVSSPLAGWPELAAILPVLAGFAAVLPSLRFLYPAIGSVAWPLTTLVLCLTWAPLLPLLAAASTAMRRRVVATAALTAAAGGLVALCLPAYSADWPQRINIEYWLDADTRQAHYLARCDCDQLPAPLASGARFDRRPHPRFAGSAELGFYAAAPVQSLAAPELTLNAPPRPIPGFGTHFELHLRSVRSAAEALVVFPASFRVLGVELPTSTGLLQAKLAQLTGGSTLLDLVALPPAGVDFSVNIPGRLPVLVQVFDQSYDVAAGGALQGSRPQNATSSQDGDLTVVHRTVSLDPAADR